jgi:aspartate aminotransferase
MVALAGGTSVIAKTSADEDFKLTPNVLEACITSKTKWLILNSPSNPTGAVYTNDEMKALTDILVSHPHVHVMSDDIYEHIRYDDAPSITPAQVEPSLFDRTLTVNGVSKSHAMTGWRIGFAGGNVALIKAMATLQSQSTSNACSISQAATVEALNASQDFLKERNAAFKTRRDLVVAKLNAIDGLTCATPGGAFYVFPSCEGLVGKTTPAGALLNNCTDVASYLLEDALVAVVPGIAFGMENFFRISYATSNDILEEACTRIANACAKLS